MTPAGCATRWSLREHRKQSKAIESSDGIDFGIDGRRLFAAGRRIEYLSNFSREIALYQGLLDERCSGVQTAVMHNCIARVAGHKNNLCSRPSAFYFRCQLSAVFAR